MALDKTDLKLLKKSLGRGGIKGVYDECVRQGLDFSYQYIYNIISGYAYRQDILDIALNYLKKEKEANEKTAITFKKKLNDIIN